MEHIKMVVMANRDWDTKIRIHERNITDCTLSAQSTPREKMHPTTSLSNIGKSGRVGELCYKKRTIGKLWQHINHSHDIIYSIMDINQKMTIETCDAKSTCLFDPLRTDGKEIIIQLSHKPNRKTEDKSKNTMF
ncbi:hypothetical protein ACJX0J_008158 [Zea mays]